MIRATLRMRVRPGLESEFTEAWGHVARSASEVAGNLWQCLLRGGPGEFVITSDWTSREAFHTFERSPEQEVLTARLRELRCASQLDIAEIVACVEGEPLGITHQVIARRDAAAGRIDVHHHVMPDAVRDWLVSHGCMPPNPAFWPPFMRWSLDEALTTMDLADIQLGVVSATIPSTFFSSAIEAAELARLANESLADLVAAHPTRFGLFAYLPLPFVDAALAELEYALDTLGADGVILMAHAGDTYLGDPMFEPIFAELARRSTVVLVHPFNLPSCGALPMPAFVVDFMADTTRAAVSLMTSGTLDRYPDLTVILPHSGGILPYEAARLTLAQALGCGLDAETVARALRRFYYDTAAPMSPYATPTLLAAAGEEQILYGSDYNAVPPRVVTDGLAALVDDPVLSAAQIAKIGRLNALRLLPTVARRLSADGPEPFGEPSSRRDHLALAPTPSNTR
jgi:predicted TIM-barrel fold metal-dependent hydrolase/heme-degrading monooxygenase HmoA